MNLNACLARLWNRRGEACGTAFWVGKDRLLTSASAAGAALDADLRCDEPQGDLLLDFPGLGAQKFVRAEAVAWQQDEVLDYAVLAPLEPLPPGLIPPPLLPLGIEETARHPMHAAGFHAGADQPSPAPGQVTGSPANQRMPVEGGLFAQSGFNGAPVIDEVLSTVIGLVSAPSTDAAYLIPFEGIAAQWPQLLEETFQALQWNWSRSLPEDQARPTARVPSPLNDAWRRLSSKLDWHERLSKKLADIAAHSQAFPELQPLAGLAAQVDPDANYEEIRAMLQVFNQRRDLAAVIDQLLARYERKTLLSAGQIRGSRYNPSREEEEQLTLDDLRQNLNDLREAARAPEYGRCFFVLGGPGSGKTHFLTVDLPRVTAGVSLTLYLRDLPASGDFEALLLANLRAVGGAGWPDLQTFARFLTAYSAEFVSGPPARLVVAVDDLGDWERARPGFIHDLVSTIRRATRYHQVYWIACLALEDYHLAADQSAETPAFWHEYAGARNPDLSYIDGWLALDDLNQSAAIGTGVIHEGIKKHADWDEVSRALSDAAVAGRPTLLNNPLAALAFLDQNQAPGAAQAGRPSWIALLDRYWTKNLGQPPHHTRGVRALQAAREIFSRSGGQTEPLETAFSEVDTSLRITAMEAYLLLLDYHRGPATALDACRQVLASSSLPHAPVWSAGSRGSPALQKGLVERAWSAARRPMDGQALVALLHFFKTLPPDGLPVQERLAILQPVYTQIQPGGYAAFFYYAVEQMFKQLRSTDELALSLISLSGCEPTGLAEDLANLALETLLSFYDGQGPNTAFLARWLLDYLAELIDEYREHSAIPGQERGWRRTLFREFVLNSFLRWLCRSERLNAYALLKQAHWYDDRRLRANSVLALQKEREANIAIGALFRYDSKEGFLKFAAGLCESPSEHDRRNAFYIIRHSEHITEERPIPMLDERFQPLLEKLFLDSALDRVLQSRAYYDLFRQNLRDFKALEIKRGRRPG